MATSLTTLPLSAGAASAAKSRAQALDAELNTVTAAAPAALKSVKAKADAYGKQKNKRDAEIAAFAMLNAQATETARLSERLGPRRAHLQKLRDGHLLLHTLVLAHDQSQAVEVALRRAAEAAAPAAGAASAPMQALLRLHALRASVRAAAAAAQREAEEAGEAAAAPDAIDANTALLTVLDERIHRLLPLLKPPILERLSNALTAVGWPAELNINTSAAVLDDDSEGPPSLRELRAAVSEALLLQFVCDPSAADVGVPDEEDAGEEPLWAIGTLLAPLLVRFRFHFETSRETNRRDKPEWMYSHVAKIVQLHTAFLTTQMPVMLRAPLSTLRNEINGQSARRAEALGYVGMLANRCPHGVLSAVTSGLCLAIRRKLIREQPTLIAHPQLFCHTLNETLAFERELREATLVQTPALPSTSPLVLHAFYSKKDAFAMWLRIEGEDARSMLKRVTAAEGDWTAGFAPNHEALASESPAGVAVEAAPDNERQSVLAGGTRSLPPACIVSLVHHLESQSKRISLLGSPMLRPSLSSRRCCRRSRTLQSSCALASRCSPPVQPSVAYPEEGGASLVAGWELGSLCASLAMAAHALRTCRRRSRWSSSHPCCMQ